MWGPLESLFYCCGRIKWWLLSKWEHMVRGALIGSMILLSQTLLQTWYAVAPSVFTSNTLLGYANGFGDVFDLVTAVILGKLPRNRLRVHLCLLFIGISGCGASFYCSQYQIFEKYHDYVIFFGFCTVGIATCFQPMLMLCNVEEPRFTRINGYIFAVFKQISWGTTWAISSFVFNRLGFAAIIVNSFILLVILVLLALLTSFVDPFQKRTEQDSRSVLNEASPAKADSEHGAETSPDATPELQSDPGENHPHYSNIIASYNSIGSRVVESGNALVFAARSYQMERSKGYSVMVMVITGCFTFEAAVHSTALEKLMQEQWKFSNALSINYFCMIPCIAALLFPIIPILTSMRNLRPRLKYQVCVALAILSITNASLPFIPWVNIATGCAVATVMARTLLLGSMAPFVDLCTREKKVQARLIMIQNMCYNGTWSVASVISGYMCTDYIQYPFVIGAAFEFLLLVMCIIIL